MKRIVKYIPGTMVKRQEQIAANPPPKPVRPATEFPTKCKKQKEHIVGMHWYYDDSGPAHATEVDKINDDNRFEAFRFCPNCGKNVVRLIKKIRKEK